jgi:hypothetical protein
MQFLPPERGETYTFLHWWARLFTKNGSGPRGASIRVIEVARTGGPMEQAKATNGTAGFSLCAMLART